MAKSIFQQRLSELIKKSGKTQKQISEELGISQSALSNFLSDKWGNLRTPRASTIQEFAKHFNVSADYLQGISDVPSIDISIQDICHKTGLSQCVIEFLINRNTSEKNRPDAFLPDVEAINKIVEEYAEAENPNETALSAIIELFNIPRRIIAGEKLHISVELLGKRKTTYNEQAEAVEYLENIYSARIVERLKALSRGSKDEQEKR